MITEGKINVHPELRELYKTATCCDGVGGCCCQNKEDEADTLCIAFVGCGLPHMCKKPCRHCLAWEGYGGEETVEAIKASSPTP